MLAILLILCRSEITCPAPGAATTTVPGVALGGGTGESDLNKGWMCASLSDACCVKAARWAWIVREETGL
jgi:hypothetical protein